MNQLGPLFGKCPLNWTVLTQNVDKFNLNLIQKAWKFEVLSLSLLCKLKKQYGTTKFAE